MNKIVILVSHHERLSREFKELHKKDYQIIDWYVDSTDRKEYINSNMPSPYCFPSIVDTEHKVIIGGISNINNALTNLNNEITKKSAIKKVLTEKHTKMLNEMLRRADAMTLEVVLGERNDVEDIKRYKTEIKNLLKNLDTMDLNNNIVYPVEPKKEK